MKKRLPTWKGILLFLSILGPGIITASVDNDAGGIATYSIAGAHFGYALLWTLIPITVALVVVQEMAARMGVVTGKTLADLVREKFGVRPTFFLLIALVIANLGNTVAEFAGWASAWEIAVENRIDELHSLMGFLDPSVLGPLFRFNRDFNSKCM